MIPQRGERRRSIALASLLTLVMYLLLTGTANLAPGSGFSQVVQKFMHLPALTQILTLAIIWTGGLLMSLAQRQIIAHGEGGFVVLLAITQTRGLRTIGLLSTALMVGLLVIAVGNMAFTPHIFIVGVLSTLTLLALGLPNAPLDHYQLHQELEEALVTAHQQERLRNE